MDNSYQDFKISYYRSDEVFYNPHFITKRPIYVVDMTSSSTNISSSKKNK